VDFGVEFLHIRLTNVLELSENRLIDKRMLLKGVNEFITLHIS